MMTRHAKLVLGSLGGFAGLAVAIGPSIDINGGRFTINVNDEYNTLGTYSYARVEMLGGVVNSVTTSDNSTFEMLGGRLNTLSVIGASSFTLAAGEIRGLVTIGEDATLIQSGGSCSEAYLVLDARLEVSGGGIEESIAALGNSRVEIAARSFSYDHDDDPATANIPIEFGDEHELTLSLEDLPAYSAEPESTLITGLTPTWGDGSSTTFGFSGVVSSPDDRLHWIGELTLVRYHAADFTGDRVVNTDDLGILLGAWGPCGSVCEADFDGDGEVATRDLAFMLANWSE